MAGEITSIQAGENWPMISKNMKRVDGMHSELKAIFEDMPRAKSGRQNIPPEKGKSAKWRFGSSRGRSSFSRSGSRKIVVEEFSTVSRHAVRGWI
jgi:hypothetical protein